MNMNDYVQFNYLPSIFEEPKKKFFLSKTESVKMSIGENGTLNIKDHRYLKLGKISLYDPVTSRYMNDKTYIGVLDSYTGKLMCIDVRVIYEECILKDNPKLNIDSTSYTISPAIRDIVSKSIEDEKKHKVTEDFY